MKAFRTHYDNLKVARDAPQIVIRAAYESLSQRFHAGKAAGDNRAVQVMSVIDRSYSILTDPKLRAEHDAWIAREEARLRSGTVEVHPTLMPSQLKTSHVTTHSTLPSRNTISDILRWPFRIMIRIFIAVPHFSLLGLLLGGIALYDAVAPKPLPPPGPKPYSTSPVAHPPQQVYSRPSMAPNGSPWPPGAGYVDGYQVLANDGLSEVTVENGQNDSDVFVKLVNLDGPQAFPVRQFFIAAHSHFMLRNVSAGNYDIRYRDLKTGRLSRSEGFVVEQVSTPMGTQYSTITMTLYKVRDGNFQTYALAESEF